MKTIWTRADPGIDLVQHQFGATDEDLALRINHRGLVAVRGLTRDEALDLAAVIQAHYADAEVTG